MRVLLVLSAAASSVAPSAPMFLPAHGGAAAVGSGVAADEGVS